MEPNMKNPQSKNKIARACALIAAVLTLPVLSYAGTDNGKGNDGVNPGRQNGNDNDPRVSSVPEANTALVLIPFFGAVLLFGAYRFHRRQKNASGLD